MGHSHLNAARYATAGAVRETSSTEGHTVVDAVDEVAPSVGNFRGTVSSRSGFRRAVPTPSLVDALSGAVTDCNFRSVETTVRLCLGLCGLSSAHG